MFISTNGLEVIIESGRGTQAGTWRQESAPEGGGGCLLVHSQDLVYLALLLLIVIITVSEKYV